MILLNSIRHDQNFIQTLENRSSTFYCKLQYCDKVSAFYSLLTRSHPSGVKCGANSIVMMSQKRIFKTKISLQFVRLLLPYICHFCREKKSKKLLGVLSICYVKCIVYREDYEEAWSLELDYDEACQYKSCHIFPNFRENNVSQKCKIWI